MSANNRPILHCVIVGLAKVRSDDQCLMEAVMIEFKKQTNVRVGKKCIVCLMTICRSLVQKWQNVDAIICIIVKSQSYCLNSLNIFFEHSKLSILTMLSC